MGVNVQSGPVRHHDWEAGLNHPRPFYVCILVLQAKLGGQR
jgi:hypothetical protein